MTPSVDDWCRGARRHMTSYALASEATNGSEEEVMKTLAALLIAVCCITPAFAQPQDPVAVVAHVLELSSDQITQWGDILHARQVALEPLVQQAQAQEQAIGQALAATSPDPLAVGQAVVAMHALQTQIAAVNAQSAADFEKVLTPDQLKRLNDIRNVAHVCPIVPAFQAAGLLGN